jgi:hypothetical protein
MTYDLADFIKLRADLTRRILNICTNENLTYSEALDIAESILEDFQIRCSYPGKL